MINLYKQDGEILYGIKEYLLDSSDDLVDLPRDVRTGSTALVISTGAKYVLDGNKNWVIINSPSGGSGGSDVNPEFNNFINSVDVNRNNIVDTVELVEF